MFVDDHVVIGRRRVVRLESPRRPPVPRPGRQSRTRRSCRRCRTPHPARRCRVAVAGNGVCTSPKSPDPISSARPLAASQVSKPCDSGPVSAYRSAKLRHVTSVFSGEVMTLMPSMPIWSSMKLMPFLLAEGRLLLLDGAGRVGDVDRAVAQEREPSPVPGPSTEYWTSGLAALKSPATIELIGSTVDDPEMTISPARPASPLPPLLGEGDDPPPHAASSSIPATARVAGVRTRAGVRLNGSLLQWIRYMGGHTATTGMLGRGA